VSTKRPLPPAPKTDSEPDENLISLKSKLSEINEQKGKIKMKKKIKGLKIIEKHVEANEEVFYAEIKRQFVINRL